MSLAQETYQAYADCHMKDFEKALTLRNLNWIGQPSNIDEAHSALLNACQYYNNFDTHQIFILLKDICKNYEIKVSPAREGSVALYLYCLNEKDTKAIFKKLKKETSLCYDELQISNQNTIRMWWD